MNFVQISRQNIRKTFFDSQNENFNTYNQKVKESFFQMYLEDLTQNELNHLNVLMVETDEMIDKSKPYIYFTTNK